MPAKPRPNSRPQFAEEGDWLSGQFLGDVDQRMSPEEYAARNAHLWGSFSLHLHPYHDPVLGAWVRRLGEILASDVEIERCRRHFLSPEELAIVNEQACQPF